MSSGSDDAPRPTHVPGDGSSAPPTARVTRLTAARDHTVLVANRGEIARRILRTAREMGYRTAVVFSDADAGAPHVAEADVAVRLRGVTATETYLDVDAVLGAARRCAATAVHPGYGFLSENADFARAVLEAGLVFIGPSPAAIAEMGDKVAAKVRAEACGVPTLPSAPLDDDDPERWLAAVEAAGLGWPVLVKAAAGGGGRGMRLVAGVDDLAGAVGAARREALSSFGDPTVFAERWLSAPRHIEIQVVADRFGHVVHLGERECSIQRRHQKVIEEAPSPAVDAALRARMGEAAVALAQAIGYEGVGTVELLLDDSAGDGPGPAFYFLEMNTRLQVEHPVTEEVTGLDLVRLQLEVAAGQPLGLDQGDVRLEGHAIEARIYAENPARGYLPSTGTVTRWDPPSSPAIRWDSGVEGGTEISPFYDAMVAKAIARAPTRAEAAGRLRRALLGLRVHGVDTNRNLLASVLAHRDFLEGRTPTSFLDRVDEVLDLSPRHGPLLPWGADGIHLAAAAAALSAGEADGSPWSFARPGWRNVGPGWMSSLSIPADDERDVPCQARWESPTVLAVRCTDDDGTTISVRAEVRARTVTVDGPGNDVAVEVRLDTGRADDEGDGSVSRCLVAVVGPTVTVNSSDGQSSYTVPSRLPEGSSAGPLGGGPTAPVPGRVTSVEVSPGDAVAVGQTLVMLEAMKVEHRVTASTDGLVGAVLVAPGDNVDAHQLLVRIDPPAP